MDEKQIAVVATLDTKGDLAKYLVKELEKRGCGAITIDGGIQGDPVFIPDVTREKVAEATGVSMGEICGVKEEGKALEMMAQGITQILVNLLKKGALGGVVGLGGGMGTSLCTSVMKNLPFGVPKLMVSTMAGGDVTPFVGTKDIMMFHTVVDLVGLNVITRSVLGRAAGAAVGMLQSKTSFQLPAKKVIGFGTIGGTEACVRNCISHMNVKDMEAVVYHTNGTGGMALEDAAREGFLSGIIEVSVRELVDHLFGGVCDGGPDRFRWVGGEDIPKVIIPGSADFIVLGPVEGLPAEYRNRQCHVHHHAMTLVRTDYHELEVIAEALARKVSRLTGRAVILFPKRGFSCHDEEGMHFFDVKKNEYFLYKLKQHLKGDIPVKDIEAHINDSVFSEMVVQTAFSLFD